VNTQDVSLVAEVPEKVQLQKQFSLLVFLSSLPIPQSKDSFFVPLPAGSVVDIVLRPDRGIIIEEGHGEGTLVVSREDETPPLQFKLRGVSLGLGQIRIDAFFKGQPLGKLKLRVVIQEEPTHAQPFASYEQFLEPVRLQYPDLSLLIEEHSGSKTTFTFKLTASDPAIELYLKQFGPTHLEVDPQRYFQDFFRDIEILSPTSSSKQMMATRLATKGMSLFEALLPVDLQEVLWSLRDRIRSVQVQSEEPWIPWELCKLCGKENGHTIEGPFLCEAFAITRWVPGISIKPRLSLNNIALVAPMDSGLVHVVKEREYLLSLRDRKRNVHVIPANFLDLYEAFAAGKYDGWHFSGHGRFSVVNSDRSVMYLENDEALTPENLQGIAKNLGIPKPLVFLNACQIGRTSMSLTGIGGWASQFLKVGAGAFIGAYWSIDDASASAFAQAFYRRLLGEIPIGEAARQARSEIRSNGDSTWLAYTIFADPLAILQKEPSSEA
jgi:CHAT domain